MLLTGTGIVPPESFTLAAGDRITWPSRALASSSIKSWLSAAEMLSEKPPQRHEDTKEHKEKRGNMKITAIETLQWAEFPRLLVVRVHTDAGIVGLGETVDKVPGTKGALHGTVAPLVLGQDPLDIEGLWRFVMDNIMYHGYAGAETRALSALGGGAMGHHGQALRRAALSPAGRQDTRRGCPPTTPASALARCRTTRPGMTTPARWRKVVARRWHQRHEDLAVRPIQRRQLRPVHSARRRLKKG